VNDYRIRKKAKNLYKKESNC